jgi:hypothetical protein
LRMSSDALKTFSHLIYLVKNSKNFVLSI